MNRISIKAAFIQLISWVNKTDLIAGQRKTNSKAQLDILRQILFNCDFASYQHLLSLLNNQDPRKVRIWLLPHTTLYLIEFILREYHAEIFIGQFLDIEDLLNGKGELTPPPGSRRSLRFKDRERSIVSVTDILDLSDFIGSQNVITIAVSASFNFGPASATIGAGLLLNKINKSIQARRTLDFTACHKINREK